jgi:hypothetical protein
MEAPELAFPFAGELHEQHAALRTAIRWLQAELASPDADRRTRARALEFLSVFREQLVQHFRFEELSGFDGGAFSSDSEIQGWTQELMRQHHALEAQLGTLIGRLEADAGAEQVHTELLAELGDFFRALRRHDAEENALILWITQGPTDFVREPSLP